MQVAAQSEHIVHGNCMQCTHMQGEHFGQCAYGIATAHSNQRISFAEFDVVQTQGIDCNFTVFVPENPWRHLNDLLGSVWPSSALHSVSRTLQACWSNVDSLALEDLWPHSRLQRAQSIRAAAPVAVAEYLPVAIEEKSRVLCKDTCEQQTHNGVCEEDSTCTTVTAFVSCAPISVVYCCHAARRALTAVIVPIWFTWEM